MPFNPLQNYLQGQQAGQQQQVNTLQNSLAGQMQQQGFDPSNSPELQRLSALDPQRASAILSNFQALDKPRQKAFFEDARDGAKLLEQGNINGFLDLANERLDHIKKLGGRPGDTKQIIDMVSSGDVQGAYILLKQTEQHGIDGGFLKDPLDRQIKEAQLKKSTQTGGEADLTAAYTQSSNIYSDGTVVGIRKNNSRFVITPDGEVVTGPKAREVVAAANKREIDSKKELKDLEVNAALSKERAKGMVEREKEDITLGVGAAQTIPILMRADKLLDIVNTGKPEAALLWGKKMMGLESGNETELEQLLGKQIVKQLKPTFGGSFSVQEGEWLKGMEAEWGRSTEGNRRLIRQGLALANKRADVGYAAAESSGDGRTTGVIQGYRDWRFPDSKPTDDAQKSIGEMSLEELKALRASQGK